MSLKRHFAGSKFRLFFFLQYRKGLTAVTESLIASLCPIITDKLMKSQFMVVATQTVMVGSMTNLKVLDKLMYIITHTRMLPIGTANIYVCHYKLLYCGHVHHIQPSHNDSLLFCPFLRSPAPLIYPSIICNKKSRWNL